MTEAIRLLHFADVHIGMENYGKLDPATGTSSRVRDFLDRLDEMIDQALEQEADLAIFAGDAFKNRDPDPTQQREFALRIKRLAQHMPTLLLVGNHDMPGVAVRASSIDIFQALEVPGVIVARSADGRVVQTRRGEVFLAWMPYPVRNRLLISEEHQGKSIKELELALRESVATILQSLAARAAQHSMPRVLAGHFSVDEAHFGSERSVMLGRDVAVQLSSLADPAWDYIALGHIHRHQVLNPGSYPPVVYSGSLERIDFGEEKEEKGFCWVELKRGETQWEFRKVDARRFHTIDITAQQENEVTAQVIAEALEHEVKDAIVRLRIRMEPEQQLGLREREIQAALEAAASVSIQRIVEQETRTRLNDLSPEALTPLELVRRYFESRAETPERLEALMARAEELLHDPD